MKEFKEFSIESKLKLSKILERIEIDINKKDTLELLDSFHRKGSGHVIGITGPPGVGKSSIINKLISSFRDLDSSIAVLAIDPSSMRSGGALLGDRARFDIDPSDAKVFVRSMAAKDYLGGISELTYPYMAVMRSIFDIVIIETVGVGQSEVSIENIADTIIYCVQPGSGDTLQFMKSGIVEIPDIMLVTKSDLEALSNNTITDLVSSKGYLRHNSDWEIKILAVSAHKNSGFKELIESISQRWIWLKKNKTLYDKRFIQDLEWIKKSILDQFGYEGFLLVEKKINYENNPFLFLHTLKKKFIIKVK